MIFQFNLLEFILADVVQLELQFDFPYDYLTIKAPLIQHYIFPYWFMMLPLLYLILLSRCGLFLASGSCSTNLFVHLYINTTVSPFPWLAISIWDYVLQLSPWGFNISLIVFTPNIYTFFYCLYMKQTLSVGPRVR